MSRTNLVLKIAILAGAVGYGADRPARADDADASFHIKNSLKEKVSVYVASEKSTKTPPWTHVEMEPRAEQTITLHGPDPYTVMVDIGAQRSLSKPIPLKAFLAKHPNYVLSVNLVAIMGTGKGGDGLGGEIRFNFAPPPSAGAGDATPESLEFAFAYEFHSRFNVKNNLDKSIGVWLTSDKRTQENPWAHLDVQPGDEAKFNLWAQGKYTLVVDVGSQRGRSKPIALKSFLEKHPGYVLTINGDNTLGAPPEGAPLWGYKASMQAPPDDKSDKASGPDDHLDFDFKAEKQQ